MMVLVPETSSDPVLVDRPVAQTPPVATSRSRLLTGAAAAAVAAAAVVSGMSVGGADKRLVVLPIALVLAAALAALACTRFGAFVLLLLGIRASIDLFKLSGASAGNTLNNTASARGLDPSSILGLLFLLAGALWLAAQYSRDGRLPGSRLRLALVAFTLACVVSLPGSGEPQVSALECLRISSVMMMFVVLEQLITDRHMLKKVLAAAYASLAFPLLYTLYGFVAGSPASEVKGSFTRITGPFSQSNTFARYLAFMIIFGVAILPYLHRRSKVAMSGALILSTVFLVLTLTRGALVGAVIGVIVVAIVQRRTALLVGFAITALALVVAVPGLGARFAELGSSRPAGGAPTGNTLQWRIDYWTAVLPLANTNPVTGIGLNMTQYRTSEAKQPHNDFIRAYVETGLLGLITYSSMLLALVANAARALRRATRGTFEHGVAAGALGASICFILGSAAANVMSNVVSLWYLVAFSAAASFVARRPDLLPGPPARSPARHTMSSD